MQKNHLNAVPISTVEEDWLLQTQICQLLSSLKILFFRIHVGKQKVGVFPKEINPNMGQIKLVHIES